ncbi:MAG: TetR/AcrR family transcriptional regulator [Phycisphaerae bacterium]
MDNMTLTRKEKEKIRHRREILKASLKLFSEKGFHNVSMQDIAAQAEFGVGTLYNFFQSKEQLFAELSNDCAEKIYQILWPFLDAEGREDVKVRTFIKLHGKLVEENIEFIKLYVSERGHLTVSRNSGYEQADKVKILIREKLEDIINAGIQNKIFRDVDALIASLSIVAAIQSLVFEYSEDFTKAKMEQGLAKIEHLFVDSLLLTENRSNG